MTRCLPLLALLTAACAPVVAGVEGGLSEDLEVGDDGASDGTDGTDPSADPVGGALFDTDRVLEVSVELAPEDWAALRRETRSMFDVLAGDCMAEPAKSPYSWFVGSAVIDGERVDDVAVRKKGFIGSLSTDRPGLKLDFDNEVDDRLFYGLERMTLNNTPQDPTRLRTCLAYEHFRAAGVPAPRCSFVHLTVNGEDLGVYSHVETLNDRFVERLTGDPDTPLFEGTLSDLRDGWTATYDPDSDAADPALLAPIVAAVESGDLDQIAAVVDLDAFVAFSTGEAMTGHWDGYGWNTNNYFLYIDPADGKARFLPWGPDAAWSSRNPGGGQNWLAANSALPRAIATTDAGLDLYLDEGRRQLEDVWDEGAMLAEAERLADLIAPFHRTPPDHDAWLTELLERQDRVMESGLEGGAPDLTGPLREALCMPERGTIDLSFAGLFGSLGGDVSPGTCALSLTWDGAAAGPVDGVAYLGREGARGISACVVPWGADAGGELLAYLDQPLDELVPGAHVTEHTVTRASLHYRDASTGWEWSTASWMEGEIVLTEAAAEPGAAIDGRYTGTLWSPAW